jgi:drug/metabolite transporter (DMT)-like permease
MKTFSSICLIAAVWGASHVWVRVAVPVFGAAPVAWARITLGGFLMLVLVRLFRQGGEGSFRTHFRHWLVVGALNGALPFLLFAQASRELPASYLSILNSLTPSFSAVFTWFLLGERPGLRTALGLLAGFAGVILIEEFGPVSFSKTPVKLALLEGIAAAACYGLVGIYIKKRVPPTDPRRMVAGSFSVASFFLLPFALQAGLPGGEIPFRAMVSVILLGVLSSALAFVWYYRLLERIGPFRSSLVTQMIPVFGVLWGAIFLNEHITPLMLFGAGLVLSSTILILSPSRR